jgi:hypothetical protein
MGRIDAVNQLISTDFSWRPAVIFSLRVESAGRCNAPTQKSIFTLTPKPLHNPRRKCCRSLRILSDWSEFDVQFGPNLNKMYLELEAF